MCSHTRVGSKWRWRHLQLGTRGDVHEGLFLQLPDLWYFQWQEGLLSRNQLLLAIRNGHVQHSNIGGQGIQIKLLVPNHICKITCSHIRAGDGSLYLDHLTMDICNPFGPRQFVWLLPKWKLILTASCLFKTMRALWKFDSNWTNFFDRLAIFL